MSKTVTITEAQAKAIAKLLKDSIRSENSEDYGVGEDYYWGPAAGMAASEAKDHNKKVRKYQDLLDPKPKKQQEDLATRKQIDCLRRHNRRIDKDLTKARASAMIADIVSEGKRYYSAKARGRRSYNRYAHLEDDVNFGDLC